MVLVVTISFVIFSAGNMSELCTDVGSLFFIGDVSHKEIPPQSVIDIFEDEGFIWGGKWVIWDNMHFEYHPELILEAKRKKGLSQN